MMLNILLILAVSLVTVHSMFAESANELSIYGGMLWDEAATDNRGLYISFKNSNERPTQASMEVLSRPVMNEGLLTFQVADTAHVLEHNIVYYELRWALGKSYPTVVFLGTTTAAAPGLRPNRDSPQVQVSVRREFNFAEAQRILEDSRMIHSVPNQPEVGPTHPEQPEVPIPNIGESESLRSPTYEPNEGGHDSHGFVDAESLRALSHEAPLELDCIGALNAEGYELGDLQTAGTEDTGIEISPDEAQWMEEDRIRMIHSGPNQPEVRPPHPEQLEVPILNIGESKSLRSPTYEPNEGGYDPHGFVDAESLRTLSHEAQMILEEDRMIHSAPTHPEQYVSRPLASAELQEKRGVPVSVDPEAAKVWSTQQSEVESGDVALPITSADGLAFYGGQLFDRAETEDSNLFMYICFWNEKGKEGIVQVKGRPQMDDAGLCSFDVVKNGDSIYGENLFQFHWKSGEEIPTVSVKETSTAVESEITPHPDLPAVEVRMWQC